MAVPQRALAFLELLEKSKLLTPEEVADAIARHHFQPDQDPREVAQALLKDRVITRFQASQLLKGRYRGFVIDGYKLLEILGAGGMGLVYVALDTQTGRRVAIKLLTERGQSDAGVRARFEMEARAGRLLEHPHIVRTFAFGRSDEIDYIVMEMVEAVSLEEYIRQERRVAVPQACSIIAQAAKGLQHAHDQGMIHRDVKPANLLVDRSGGVKILDFGLALVEDDEGSEFSLARIFGQDRVGTADFTSPEQTLDSFTVDRRADIYSLGCTLYTTLAGQVPFPLDTVAKKLEAHRTKQPKPIQEIAQDVPDGLAQLLESMMAKSAADRPDNMTEVYNTLGTWAQRSTIRFDFQKILTDRIAVAKRRTQLEQERKRREASAKASASGSSIAGTSGSNVSSNSWANRGLSSGNSPSGLGSGSHLHVRGANNNGKLQPGPTVIKHMTSGEVLLELPSGTLVGIDLSSAQLAGADLQGLDLSQAILAFANLREANLRQAKLAGARLHGTVLNDANLEEAILARAVLTDASLTNCKFRAANLQQADFRRAIVNGADFSAADLTGADLSMAQLKANFRDANLACANLAGSTLTGSDLTGANLDGANVHGANFRGCVAPSGQPNFSVTLK